MIMLNYYYDRNGFFLGNRPHCVDVFIDEEHQEAIINNFSYFTNCSVGKIFDFPTEQPCSILLELYSNLVSIVFRKYLTTAHSFLDDICFYS